MNAKARRHERRKAEAIKRSDDKRLSVRIEELITGVSHKVNSTLSLPSFRERKVTEMTLSLKPQDKPVTARASQKIVRHCVPLI